MNVAIYYHKPLYESAGGVGRVATWLSRRLVAAGHQVWCFVPSGFKVEGVPCIGVTCDEVETVEIPQGSIRRQRKFVKGAFRERGIEVVFNQCGVYKYSGVVLGCGARVVTTHHSSTAGLMFYGGIPFGTSAFHKGLKILGLFSRTLAVKVYDRIMYWKLSTIIKRSDVFTFLAPSYRDWMVKYFPRYADKFHVISNPIPFEHDNISDFKKKVLFVGRVDPEKRVERLIEVWSRLPEKYADWELQIVGPGTELERMKALAQEKMLANIVFTGCVDVREYYSHASIICLTSDVEGVPMVLREAMSYGIAPIIFNSFPAAVEMITDHHNGRLIPAFDVDAYVAALVELMNGEAEKMRGSILESAKPYTGENIFALWRQLL